MATGAEHYKKAEELADEADRLLKRIDDVKLPAVQLQVQISAIGIIASLAQTHADLARMAPA